ncbi:hypothetical protein evm_002953 [Chilo suppressalis]|nr:hypothetical protein evm_002953 [Chilo suppressalis]
MCSDVSRRRRRRAGARLHERKPGVREHYLRHGQPRLIQHQLLHRGDAQLLGDRQARHNLLERKILLVRLFDDAGVLLGVRRRPRGLLEQIPPAGVGVPPREHEPLDQVKDSTHE